VELTKISLACQIARLVSTRVVQHSASARRQQCVSAVADPELNITEIYGVAAERDLKQSQPQQHADAQHLGDYFPELVTSFGGHDAQEEVMQQRSARRSSAALLAAAAAAAAAARSSK
jgi:hypothetical protein